MSAPLAAIVTNGSACVRLLAADQPHLADAREAVEAMIRDGLRASDVMRRIHALVQPTPPQPAWFEVNALLLEVLVLVRSDVQRQGVALQTHLAPALPLVHGDRIQVQQVVLNLLVNALDALRGISAGGVRSGAARGSPRRVWPSSSRPSIPPSQRGWAWGWRSAARLSRRTVGSCGRRATQAQARPFTSPC